jgi:hypothetical protein
MPVLRWKPAAITAPPRVATSEGPWAPRSVYVPKRGVTETRAIGAAVTLLGFFVAMSFLESAAPNRDAWLAMLLCIQFGSLLVLGRSGVEFDGDRRRIVARFAIGGLVLRRGWSFNEVSAISVERPFGVQGKTVWHLKVHWRHRARAPWLLATSSSVDDLAAIGRAIHRATGLYVDLPA